MARLLPIQLALSLLAGVIASSLPVSRFAVAQGSAVGEFEGHVDVGDVKHKGSVEYDAAAKSYAIAGSGENMWFAKDELHFVWKKVSGDVSLTADIEWKGQGGDAHRKACLLIRQGLDPDSAYVDAALHGDGLTSLQYRLEQGGPTREIQAREKGPRRLRIEKQGDSVFMSLAATGEEPRAAGGSINLKFAEPFYVGLGVCSHNADRIETAVFSNVELTASTQTTAGHPQLESTLETIAINSTDRKVVFHARDHFEAPNWSRDGKWLVYNSHGKLYKIAADGSGEPEQIPTGRLMELNNDHGFSPDGSQLVVSDQTDGPSRIFLLPSAGGEPKRITANGPSYWHGWSPDGRTLAYCAERNDNYDVYTISVDGGEEKRLTTAEGLDDGPDYSPDGKYIYFNSVRGGLMHVWRMKPDGSDQEQVTKDEFNNWFPHPSPDGKWIVFLTYDKDVEGHPENKNVRLRLMPAGGGEIRTLAHVFGGQGTINVPSWSPDSRSFAFVSYRLARP
jgi:TolB protein